MPSKVLLKRILKKPFKDYLKFAYMTPEEGRPDVPGQQGPIDDGREQRNGKPKYRGGRGGRPMKDNDYSIRILIPCKMVGAIIGTSGNKIKKITEATNTSIDIHRKEDRREVDKLVTVRGGPEECSVANMQIHKLMRDETDESLRSNEIEMRLVIHDSHAGRIIGRKGNNLKGIMEETGATSIKVSDGYIDACSGNTGDRMAHSSMLNAGDRIVSIKCLIRKATEDQPEVEEDEALENCRKAELLISSKVHECLKKDMDDLVRSKQLHQPYFHQPLQWHQGMYGNQVAPMLGEPHNSGGMMNMAQYPYPNTCPPFPQLQTQPLIRTRLAIPQKYAGALIGTKGSFCNYMKNLSCATRVHVTPDDKSGERYVEIVGHPFAQYFAQHCVYCKLAEEGYSNSDGELKLRAEVTIPTKGTARTNKDQQTNIVGRIIGKRGQNVKGLEKETRTYVKVATVEDQDGEPKEAIVQIVGSFASSQHAQFRINEIVSQCQQGTSSGSNSPQPGMVSHPPGGKRPPQMS
ncbi:insulin-like growth factor 2 mRNA-binding protein 2 isoform X3 [Actinia tenebrosa]|uniref:Insulin-like growth factor 2 mRNA-binding protein 2 isoform X3 n=1 Tax=Actinia tenebrosa TaxID=6105 RepID=A0A6P8IJ92_ACTTE|nr:insulin-like growth factor 2 mRNA-binding protein 2 isoform X3 [Actinia tenebrosa]